MRKFIFVLLVVMVVMLSGCQGEQSIKQDDGIISETSHEDCYLCGGGIEGLMPWCWGQNNVAFISLNTFDIQPLEINRYDRVSRQQIKEYAGFLSFVKTGDTENGFFGNWMLEHDRGYASGTITLRDDDTLDINKAAAFLCDDCLNEVLPMSPDRYFGIGAVNLDTKEIQAMEKAVIGFGLGDFHFEFSSNTEMFGENQIHMLVFYCPIRYEMKPIETEPRSE